MKTGKTKVLFIIAVYLKGLVGSNWISYYVKEINSIRLPLNPKMYSFLIHSNILYLKKT